MFAFQVLNCWLPNARWSIAADINSAKYLIVFVYYIIQTSECFVCIESRYIRSYNLEQKAICKLKTFTITMQLNLELHSVFFLSVVLCTSMQIKCNTKKEKQENNLVYSEHSLWHKNFQIYSCHPQKYFPSFCQICNMVRNSALQLLLVNLANSKQVTTNNWVNNITLKCRSRLHMKPHRCITSVIYFQLWHFQYLSKCTKTTKTKWVSVQDI